MNADAHQAQELEPVPTAPTRWAVAYDNTARIDRYEFYEQRGYRRRAASGHHVVLENPRGVSHSQMGSQVRRPR